MLRVPMALAFKELSNTGRSDGNPRRTVGGGPPCQTAARAAQGGAAEMTRGKWELLTEQSEVDNNGRIFSLPTERHHTFPCVNQEVQLRCKGPLGSVGSETRGEELGGGKRFPRSPCCRFHPFISACTQFCFEASPVSLCRRTEQDDCLFTWKTWTSSYCWRPFFFFFFFFTISKTPCCSGVLEQTLICIKGIAARALNSDSSLLA